MKLILNDTVHFNDIQSQIINAAEPIESVEFKHTDTKLLLQDLDAMITWENSVFDKGEQVEGFKAVPLNTLFKTLSLDNKIEVLKYALAAPEVVNSNLLLNIFILITSDVKYHEDDVFLDERVIFGQQGKVTGLEEFLDIKIALKPALSDLYKEIMKYYLSCLCSLHYKETDIAYDNLIILPVKYNQLLSFLTFTDLSKLSRHVGGLNSLELVSVYNAKSILEKLILKEAPAANLASLFSTLMRSSNE